MQNKISDVNPFYARLKTSTFVVFLLAIILAMPIVSIALINANNLNGQVTEVTGTVTKVTEDDDVLLLELDGENRYTVEPVRDKMDDWDVLSGQTVTLILPQKQLRGDRWVLGIKQGDETLIDFEQTIKDKIAENTLLLIIFGILVGLFLIGSALLYAWQKKTPPTVEKEIAHVLCESVLFVQPCGPLYRKNNWLLIAYLTMTLAFCIALCIVGTVGSELATIIVAIVLCTLFAAASVGLMVYTLVYLPKKEREYYAEHYPFHSYDEHVGGILRKRAKEMQERLLAQRKAFPHRYCDGSSGLLCDFTEKGVVLFDEDPDSEGLAPTANEVFGEGGDSPEGVHNMCELTYEELNFEAVPYYRPQNRPLFIVIKSRLEKTVTLHNGAELEHDIHIIFNADLLETLKHFGVQVENLDYLLENKAQLMEENCPRSKSKKKNLS